MGFDDLAERIAATPEPAPALDVETIAHLIHEVDCSQSHSGSIASVRAEFGLPGYAPWPPPYGQQAGFDEVEAGVRDQITERLREVDAAADAESWERHRDAAREYLARIQREEQP